MPRYADWFRKIGDTAASPRALDAAKKLLGYLNIRRGTPGVETLAQKVTLDDGTVVTAAFYGDQPTVTVDTSAVGGETCTLYVESGMLDLGPNIASDANNRFNRGLPEFDDRPATLYFGDGVDCQQGQGGFNGRIKVRGKTITSDCLPKQGRSVESRLHDPVKKQAQSLLPASCWSGLMQRYVQAVYGGDALDYSATATVLTIEGKTFDVKDSWGLVDIGGTLRFVKIASGIAQFYKVKPTTPCFAAVLKAWRAMPNTPKQRQNRDRMLTVALSGCVVGAEDGPPVTVPNDAHRHFEDRAAFVFSADRPRAVGVMQAYIDSADRKVYALELEFLKGDVGLSIAITTLEAAEPTEFDALRPYYVKGNPFGGAVTQVRSGLETGDTRVRKGVMIDVPLYASYTVDDAVDIVRLSLVVQDTAVAAPEYCHDLWWLSISTAWETGSKANACAGADPELRVVTAAFGLYASGWSTVRQREYLARHLPDGSLGIFEKQPLLFYAIASDMRLRECEISLSQPSWYTGVENTYGALKAEACNRANVETTGDVFFAPIEDCTGYLPPDCYNHYVWNTTGPVSVTYAFDYIAGRLNRLWGDGIAVHRVVTTLGWGSTRCVCVDEYDYAGSVGAYFSYDALSARYGAIFSEWPASFYAKRAEFSSTASVTHCVPTGGNYCGDYSGETCNDISVDLSYSYSGGYTMAGPYVIQGPLFVVNNEFGPEDTNAPVSIAFTADDYTTEAVARPDVAARGTERLSACVSSAEITQKETGVHVRIPIADSETGYPDDVVQGDYAAFTEMEADGLCPLYHFARMAEVTDEHQKATFDTTPDAETVAYALRVAVKGETFMDGCAKFARDSLLGAKTRPIAMIERGTSVHMDRETITGGYPKVSTPSFVGWA